MNLLNYPLVAALLLAASCGSESSDNADSGPDDSDATALSCAEKTSLIIGHCIDGVTDAPCVNFQSTQREFIPLENGDTIQPIIGFQGSPMFVMSVQASGVAPGENQDAAYVEVRFYQEDQDIGAFATRPRFEGISGSPQDSVAMQLFVVSFFADEMAGQSVQVTAEIEDNNGDTWCAEGNFIIGDLAPALAR